MMHVAARNVEETISKTQRHQICKKILSTAACHNGVAIENRPATSLTKVVMIRPIQHAQAR